MVISLEGEVIEPANGLQHVRFSGGCFPGIMELALELAHGASCYSGFHNDRPVTLTLHIRLRFNIVPAAHAELFSHTIYL